ncbi:MAG: hypothetical protein OXH39_14300 [Candidatus Poribacteria bacterium]|nr:hypothetical protein [Candidatus Poribacteria bacterium]
MLTYKVNPNTHQDYRSLLQKAVRRSDDTLVTKVVDQLYKVDDAAWLKRRTGVIIAEECWPLMAKWELPKKLEEQQAAIKDILSQVALSKKFKDAAGLGSLAYALSEGDSSVLTGSDEDYYIKRIRDAIKDGKTYWKWAISQCSNDPVTRLVTQAERAYRKAGWPWDKAFIQATAYLAIRDGIPKWRPVPNVKAKFPFWVALDKHTPQGKMALREVSKKTGVSWRQLNWVSFYCESGHVDNSIPSRWWDREVEWRLSKVGLSFNMAKSMWTEARPEFIKALRDEPARLEEIFGDSIPYNVGGNGQLCFIILNPREKIRDNWQRHSIFG